MSSFSSHLSSCLIKSFSTTFMESHQERKQPNRDDDPNATTTDTNTTTNTVDESINKSKQDKRKAMAKRGLKSLAVMIMVPTLLTLASTWLSGSRHGYGKLADPSSSSWLLPPRWSIHLASLATSFLMGLSAWLVWADGGFHRRPRAFQIYVVWLLLNVAWNPIALGCGATRIGLVVGLAMLGALVGCCRFFKEVNPIAGNLVMPCLALSGLLALVNLKLVFTAAAATATATTTTTS